MYGELLWLLERGSNQGPGLSWEKVILRIMTNTQRALHSTVTIHTHTYFSPFLEFDFNDIVK
jgi:hypothetical protein